MQPSFQKAAAALRQAKALVITAGAGMGVDSGLPDFRGNEGFWKAYPPYRKLGLDFYRAANPEHFEADPAFGWGFYGHRTHLYRATAPHRGFSLLQQWCDRFGLDSFVVTSNVDGQFQKAGFADDAIYEVHGSIHHLQCIIPCGQAIWESREEIPVDLTGMRARHIPLCPHCGRTARPNVLMFGDYAWLPGRSYGQQMRFDLFLEEHRADRMLVIELGAGTAIPTIRALGERLGRGRQATVIRINPYEAQIGAPHLSLPCGALEGLVGIDAALQGGSDNNQDEK